MDFLRVSDNLNAKNFTNVTGRTDELGNFFMRYSDFIPKNDGFPTKKKMDFLLKTMNSY